MKRKVALIFSLLFMLSATLAVYSECAQAAANHFDVNTEHKHPAIHCADAFVSSSTLAPSAFRPDIKKLSKALVTLHTKIDNPALAPVFRERPFREPFSHQDLFRIEEVYRL